MEMIPCRCRHRDQDAYREAHPFCGRPYQFVWDETGRRLIRRFRKP